MGDRQAAIALARDFLRQDPRFWRTRLQLADDLAAEGRFPEAIPEYRQVLEVRPMPSYERGYALEGLGVSLMRSGSDAEAEVSFREGLRASPSSASLHYNLARLLARQGRVEEALARYEEAVRLGPGNVRVRMALADHLFRLGALEAAAFQFREVARLAPEKAEALLAQGRALEAAGMKAQALSCYERALHAPALLPDTVDAIRERLSGKMP
jgi:tetratricopeptide (TPR) repeat protein